MPRKRLADSGPPIELSDDALWVWRELWEEGAELLERDRAGMLVEGFLDENDQPWTSERFDAAVAELRSASVLRTDGSVLWPEIDDSIRHVTAQHMLVDVHALVFATCDVDLGAAADAISVCGSAIEAELAPAAPRAERAPPTAACPRARATSSTGPLICSASLAASAADFTRRCPGSRSPRKRASRRSLSSRTMARIAASASGSRLTCSTRPRRQEAP